MLPMLALGIPGSATAAVMMGGLMIWGLNPGPMLFIERPDFVWGLIASHVSRQRRGRRAGAGDRAAVRGDPAHPLRHHRAADRRRVLHRRLDGRRRRGLDLWLALVFGVVGYVFKKLDYPIAPLVLAMVLGDKAEDAFRQSMLMSQGSLGIFFSNPLVATMVTLALALVVAPPLLNLRSRRAARARIDA